MGRRRNRHCTLDGRQPDKVLGHCGGLRKGAGHLRFMGVDTYFRRAKIYDYALPWAKARIHQVMLACEMNGEQLPRIHGYPLRAVVIEYIEAMHVVPSNAVYTNGTYQTTHSIKILARSRNRDPAPLYCPCPGERVSFTTHPKSANTTISMTRDSPSQTWPLPRPSSVSR